MKFLVDRCAGPGLAEWLSMQGHDVLEASVNRALRAVIAALPVNAPHRAPGAGSTQGT